MPPKPKNTREEIIQASVEIIRKQGIEFLSARNLGKKLNASPATIFTHFDTMEEVQEASISEVRKIYDQYVLRGLSTILSFKGYALEVIKFAKEEPFLFEILLMKRKSPTILKEVIAAAGHEARIISAVESTFGLNSSQAYQLYQDMYIYAHGIATLVVTGVCSFSDEELNKMLENACRGFLSNIVRKPENNYLVNCHEVEK